MSAPRTATYLGRQPRFIVEVGTGRVVGREYLRPRRVPWFRADGSICVGESEAIGAYLPWFRVLLRSLRFVPGGAR